MKREATEPTSARRLETAELCHRCDPATLEFETTAELAELDEIVGQQRAVDALSFGVGMQREGYNLYVLGPPGAGKHGVVESFLRQQARPRPTPDDHCYVHRFGDHRRPRWLHFPAGKGRRFRGDIEHLIEDLMQAIPAAFDSDEYRKRRQAIEKETSGRQEEAFEGLQKHAQERGAALLHGPMGFALAATRDGKILSQEEFEALPEEEQAELEANLREVDKELKEVIRAIPKWEHGARERIRELDREITKTTVAHSFERLRSEYADLPDTIAWLDDVEADVLEHAGDFAQSAKSDESELLKRLLRKGGEPDDSLRERYRVNLFVDNADLEGAPVVYEDHPTLDNLVGRIEYVGSFGSMVTDFTLIKPGALHRANGGYLILDIRKLLQEPYAWDGLKRCLRSREIKIESLREALGLTAASTLEPQPVALDLKIVLVGERLIYYLLCELDPDFPQLFKVAADFEDDLDRSPATTSTYARLVASMAQREELLPLDRAGVARVIDHSARMAGDAHKLSLRVTRVADLLREADHWAREAGHETIEADDVQRAIDMQIERADRIRDRSLEDFAHGTVLMDTKGSAVGQVNGLSVAQIGNFAFGRPTRITARIRLGKGEVVDIEREANLGGPIHSKGVMILGGLLGARYCRDRPLSLAATLVFEQSYGGVEGDSASLAELCALLSAIAEVPLRQSFAVTGSINQLGEVQAVGGVNEKIEGFFDVCRGEGLTGEQGVVIPAGNVRHLMLREDVVEAVAAGRFHVHAVHTVDEAVELLTGVPAGERSEAGFPEGSVNGRVEAALSDLAGKAREFMRDARRTDDDEG